MIRQIVRDPLFLQQKSSPATKDDAQVMRPRDGVRVSFL